MRAYTIMRFFRKKRSYHNNSKLHFLTAELAMLVDLTECTGHSVDSNKAIETVTLVRRTQDVLSIDDGPPFDFQVQHYNQHLLKITGNLKTALLVLRHIGLISPKETDDAAKKADKMMKKSVIKETYQTYNSNYENAEDKFFISSMSWYQEMSLNSYSP